MLLVTGVTVSDRGPLIASVNLLAQARMGMEEPSVVALVW